MKQDELERLRDDTISTKIDSSSVATSALGEDRLTKLLDKNTQLFDHRLSHIENQLKKYDEKINRLDKFRITVFAISGFIVFLLLFFTRLEDLINTLYKLLVDPVKEVVWLSFL